MKSVPLRDLKIDLSSYVERASKGEVIQVTKHNKPYILLVPQIPRGVRVGNRVGKSKLSSALKRDVTQGAWLKVLEDDRDGSL